MTYSNDVFTGTRFELGVAMPHATMPEINEVVRRVHADLGDRFDGYTVRIRFRVANSGTVAINDSRFDPASVIRDVGFVRQLAPQVPSDITWLSAPEESSVRLSDTADPSGAVEAILTVAGDHPVTISVPTAPGDAAPYWEIREPITLDLKHRIDSQFERMPGSPGFVIAGRTGIDSLTIGIADTDTAYQDLVEIIRVAEAGPDRPMSIRWGWSGDTAKGAAPDWSGSAQIGDCVYYGGRTAGNHVPEAIAVQTRIRNEFDTCPEE